MGPGAIVIVHHGGAGVVVPNEEAQTNIPGEKLRDGYQADARGGFVPQAIWGRVDAKVGLQCAPRVLESLHQDEPMRAKGLRLVCHGLEKLCTESELLILGLDEPYEIRVRIKAEVINVAELSGEGRPVKICITGAHCCCTSPRKARAACRVPCGSEGSSG